MLVPPLPMQWAENIHLRHRDASVVSQCRSAPQPTAPSPARLRPPSPVMLWWVLGAGAVCREGGAKAELLEEGGVSVLRGNSQAPWLLALGCQRGGDGLKGSPLLSRFPKLLSHGGRGGKSLGTGGGCGSEGPCAAFLHVERLRKPAGRNKPCLSLTAGGLCRGHRRAVRIFALSAALPRGQCRRRMMARRAVWRGPLHPQGFNYLLTLGLWSFSFFFFFFFPLSYLKFLAGHPETMGQHPGCEATTVESSWRWGGTQGTHTMMTRPTWGSPLSPPAAREQGPSRGRARLIHSVEPSLRGAGVLRRSGPHDLGGGKPCLGSTQLYALAVWGRGQPPPHSAGRRHFMPNGP